LTCALSSDGKSLADNNAVLGDALTPATQVEFDAKTGTNQRRAQAPGYERSRPTIGCVSNLFVRFTSTSFVPAQMSAEDGRLKVQFCSTLISSRA
jgi:hypothetical protein